MADSRVIGGRYRLVADLGSGGFGRVWKAHDEALDVDVAIKEVWLPPASSSQEQAERLARAEREARNAAKLRDHPDIVAVYDVVVDDGVPWIVMQLIDGASLEHHLATQGPLSVDQTAQVATALLRALQAADRAGIVHRDVKPGNVLITTDGHVLLTDFGIAVHSDDTALTASGMVIGSAEYMAPERAQQEATVASDLFSLGVTLYQAVEGSSPFRRDSLAATVAAVLSAPAPPPAHAGREEPLITQLLDKQPDNRPAIPQALALAATPATAHEIPSQRDLERELAHLSQQLAQARQARQQQPHSAESPAAPHQRGTNTADHYPVADNRAARPNAQAEPPALDPPPRTSGEHATSSTQHTTRAAPTPVRIDPRAPWVATIMLPLALGIPFIAGFLTGTDGRGLSSIPTETLWYFGGLFLVLLLVLEMWIWRSYEASGPLVIDTSGIRWNTNGHDREIQWDSLQRVQLTGRGSSARIIVWYHPGITPLKPARRGPHGSYLLLRPAQYGQGPYKAVNEHIRQALGAFAGDRYTK